MIKQITFALLFLFLGLSITFAIESNKSPEKVIESLYDAIDVAKESGGYNCCINPACTMCYLGHWKFEKGTCYCDDAIKEARYKDVCPECKKGLEEGLCNSKEK